MADANTAAELGMLDLEWKDEQLERVRAVFDSVDGSGGDAVLREQLAAELPEVGQAFVIGIAVFRDLLRVEHRPDRIRRLLRIWSGKVAAGVRGRDYEHAGMWFRSLVEAPVFPEEFAAIVAETRRELAAEDLFDDLVTGLVESGSPPAAGPLLAAWGEHLVEYLVGQIVTDDPKVNRRHIVDFLGMAGRGDVRHLTARLADPRWFVVRNIVIAIGKAGRASAIPALESVWDHEDDRVRVEVLRSIAALDPEGSLPLVLQSLSDPAPSVRRAAASLLRANASDAVVPGIVEVLTRGHGSADEARRLVEIVAERRGPGVKEALDQLASRRFALGASRTVRDAARQALEQWTS